MIVKKIKGVIKSFFTIQFLKFLLVGGSAAVINYLCGYYFRKFYGDMFFSSQLSLVIGFTVGTVISFSLNKMFTFKAYEEETKVQLVKFIIAAVISIFIAMFVSYIIMTIYRWLNITFITEVSMENLAHIAAIGVTTIYNFLSMRYFSFKELSIAKKTNKSINA